MKTIRGKFISLLAFGFWALFPMLVGAQEEKPLPGAISNFSDWAERYLNSSDRLAMEREGLRLAQERRAALKELIRSNPKQALEQAIFDNAEATFPESVGALLEQKVSGRGKFLVLAGIPLPGKIAEPIVRKVKVKDKTYDAFVYGKLTTCSSREEVWLSGIAVDDVIALDENSFQEVVAAKDDTAASPQTEGNKRLLLMRVDFSDVPGIAFSLDEGTNSVSELNDFYSKSSYGRAGFNLVGAGSAITPVLRMPKPSQFYSNDFFLFRDDARSVALAAGYNVANFDYDVACFPAFPGWPYCGQGVVAGTGALVSCFNVGVFAHELGHNFGLWHANFWDTSGQSVIGPGTSVEYGDFFDTMGPAFAGAYHFNVRYKNILNWIRTNEFTSVVSSGTYRIKAQDDPTATGVRALKIFKNANTNYWVEFRQNFFWNKWMMDGVGLRWAGNANEPSLLLDTTPGSLSTIDDSAVVEGRTFSDPESGVYITALRKAGTIPEAFDVVINLGTFPTNVAPNVTISLSSANVAIGSNVTLQASASDANGDALAYYWDFGEGEFGTNGAVQSHAWNFTGMFSISCIVSDMKGGTKTNSVSINVGNPPEIYAQPRSQSLAFGETATFSVFALNEPVKYFWRKNGASLPGETNSTLILTNVQASNVAQYSVLVSNRFGSVISSVAYLLVGETRNFSNATPISIPLNNPSTPYPSTMIVSGVTQTVLKVTATLNNLNHQYPGDLDILLTNPNGKPVLLMSDCGLAFSVANSTLEFDDEAVFPLPYFGGITSGIYKPTDNETFDLLPSPAPPSPYSTNLTTLIDGTVNGTWSLFVSDDNPVSDSGDVFGGWNLKFWLASNVPPAIKVEPVSRTNFTSYNATFAVETVGSAPLKYQWRKNGGNIPGATASTYSINNLQTVDAGIFSVVITNSFGTALSADATLTVLLNIAIGEAVDSPELVWNSGGHAQWFGQNSVTHNSSDAGASGTISTLQESWLETSVAGPGTLTFWWKVSSETLFDALQFQINGVEQQRISGEVGWIQQTYFLAPGNQVLRWRYSKDGSVNSGEDRGWLDQIFFTPGGTAPSILSQPIAQVIEQENPVTFTVAVQGTPPIRYQWRRNNFDLAGQTNATLFITHAHTNDNGAYVVAILNDYGSVLSSNASLLVLPNLFFDDFEPGIELSQWSVFGGEVLATNYGGSVSGSNSLWFNGDGSRFATTKPVSLSAGGKIQFYLRFASGFGFPWERLELPEEGIILEYSLTGTNWTALGLFNTSTFFDWTLVQIPLPAAANSPGTLFRWRQISNSGAGLDHWALDDVQIVGAPLAFGAVQQTSDGDFSFLLVGPSGQSCLIQTSTNLVTWTTIRTNLLTNGVSTFLDAISPGSSPRFYRAALVQ